MERVSAARPLAWIALLALGACAGAVLSGAAAALAYTEADLPRSLAGLTLQHLRPLHESFAFAWVFLGGVTVVYLYLVQQHGALERSARRSLLVQIGLWAAAGVGITVSLLAGRFTGREYLGYGPFFSLLILAGWLLFARGFFALSGVSLRGRPVYVYMWSVAIPLFVLTYMEAHLYLLEFVSRRPVRDIALQWKSNGVLVGSFNLLAYGSLTYVVGRVRGDDAYAYSRTAFALFWVGLLNTFTNYGHHTYHLPQSPWIHWISFVVSMLEIIILVRVLIDVSGLIREGPAPCELQVPVWFIRSATLWTSALLLMSLGIAVPPLNALIHGTHVVVAHSMGSMIGIDSMILWAAFAYLACCVVGEQRLAPFTRRVRPAVPLVSVSLLVFWVAFLGRGVAEGWSRFAGPAAPDMSRLIVMFPTVMAASGLALAAAVLWIVGNWMLALWSSTSASVETSR